MIKKIIAAMLLVASPFCFAKAPVKHLGNKIELIFLQHAGSGTIIADPKNKQCYRLVLKQLDERIIYISDAPARVSGGYTIPEFVETWQHNEKVDHIRPNAILHAKNQHNQWINDTAVFSNLQYNAKNATLTYTLCPLDKHKALTAGKLSTLSIFIDPFHPWPP